MTNRVLPHAWYIPWNLVVAAVLVWLALGHADRAHFGLAEWRRGAAFGAVLFAATLAVMLAGLLIPAFDGLYRDERNTTAATNTIGYVLTYLVSR